MGIEGQGHFFTIYFPGFVCFVLYWAKISGERLQDHWSSGYWKFENLFRFKNPFYYFKRSKILIDFNKCREEIAVALNEFCEGWC